MAYDIYETETGTRTHRKIGMGKAMEITGLDADSIEWAIEEYGRCDDGEYTITPHTAKAQAPGPWEE